MFDIGMSEMLVVGVVALIVVGPKDLPVMFRRVGQFVGKAKGMAREFSSAMNDAADDTGVREMASGLNNTLKVATNPVGAAMDGVKDAASSLTSLDSDSETSALSAERQENMKRIQASTARTAAERKSREAKEAMQKAEELEASLQETLSAKDAVAKPAPAKKAPAKKAAAKKPAAKTAAAKKAPAAKKATAKKAPAKKKAAK